MICDMIHGVIQFDVMHDMAWHDMTWHAVPLTVPLYETPWSATIFASALNFSGLLRKVI